MNDLSLKEFIVKYTLISSVIVWILGSQIKDFLNNIVSLIIDPFFSIDLDNNGEPDLKELIKYNIEIGKYKIPFGKLLIESIKLVLQLVIMYIIINYVLKYTNLVDPKTKKN